MQQTAEQQEAADKVVQAGQLMQHCIRQAQKLGLHVSVSVLIYSNDSNSSVVNATVSLVEKVQVAATDTKRRK